jgi:hypothetical protein
MKYLIVTEEKCLQIDAKDDFEVELYILANIGVEKVIYFTQKEQSHEED